MGRAKILGEQESLAVLRAGSKERECWFRKASHVCLNSLFIWPLRVSAPCMYISFLEWWDGPLWVEEYVTWTVVCDILTQNVSLLENPN